MHEGSRVAEKDGTLYLKSGGAEEYRTGCALAPLMGLSGHPSLGITPHTKHPAEHPSLGSVCPSKTWLYAPHKRLARALTRWP